MSDEKQQSQTNTTYTSETRSNGQLENRVEHILVNKVRLVWGIIVATLVLGGVFYKIQLDLALASQKLDTLIVSFDKLDNLITLQQEKQDFKITDLEKEILVLKNKK